mmetsp:Transcript_3528/g.5808  ORF Transcript_3528/g.5808 Transcript_3528/m.5808 type:complete len:126 (-) Transcript_3528:586-963(-)
MRVHLLAWVVAIIVAPSVTALQPTMTQTPKAALSRRSLLRTFALVATPTAGAFAESPPVVDGKTYAASVNSKTQKTLDAETAKKWKVIYEAKTKIPDPKMQETYMAAVCKSGILGPSVLAWALCK